METTTTTTKQRTHSQLESAFALDPIQLEPNFRGFVSGVVNTEYMQRAFIEVKEQGGQTIASATFEGTGKRAPLSNTFNHIPHWSFGPFPYTANLFITIYHNYSIPGSKWTASTMVGPFSVTKNPETSYPMTFHVSTVISEDKARASNDDCTVTVIQYK